MIKKFIYKHKAFLLFGCAGAIGYVVDLAITLLFGSLLGKYLARMPAFLGASFATWLFNRSITFKERKVEKSLFAEWLHYVSLMLVGLAVNYIVYIIVVHFLPASVASTAIAVGCGSVAGMFINFLSSSKFLYKK